MKPCILIYGASGTIGSATARLLVKSGYGVHLVGRNEEKLTPLARELDAGITLGDVTDSELFSRVNENVGKKVVGGVVYAVGTITLGSVRRFKAADFLTDFSVNALGAALAVQSALPRLKKNQEVSSVVLFSSVAAQKGFAMHTSMGMAKGAVNGLTLALAAELAPKVRVNAIAPSVVQTPLSEAILSHGDMADRLADQHPLKRLGNSQDIAELAAFLISDKAGWITGQIMGVDGGRSTLTPA